MSVKRIYVEKKEGCNIEAKSLLKDIKENLRIESLENVRILCRYDIEDIDDDTFEKAKTTIFSEPPVDDIYLENVELQKDEISFCTEYLPGQYDQRADSAMQCIGIISSGVTPAVNAAKLYILKGNLTKEQLDAIKKYCINPVDSREASAEKPETLKLKLDIPTKVETVEGFIAMTDEQLLAYRSELGLAMSEADIKFCQNYFKNTEKRNPTITEIKVIDTYWSDHCRHTTFATHINNVEFEKGKYTPIVEQTYKMYLDDKQKLGRAEKPVCLMDIAVMGMRALKASGKLDNLDQSEEINACSIVVPVDIDGKQEDYLIMFKNETHNHPTEIEPFGGAATCLGGAIRDPLSGRSYVYQAMRVTGAGDPNTPVEDTIEGKLPQRKLVTGAAHGYSSYGNQIGLATGQVTEIYDEGYVAKRMEIGAVIAAAPKENVIREIPEKGDIVILVGGRTGRDGCGGATGSSKEHNTESIHTCGAEVQKGNPPTERKLQRLFRIPEVAKMIRRCNDFGAGGVSVAIGELADGLDINLDLVPKKYEGLDGTELAISESQERMAVVVAKENVDKFIKYSNSENLEATAVAEVTDTRRLKMNWNGNSIVNISRDFLDTNGAVQNTDVFVTKIADKPAGISTSGDLEKQWTENLSRLNVGCQKGLTERFDGTIGAATVLMPYGGVNQLTPIEAMAAKIPLLKGETDTATLMSFGYDPSVAKWSPFHSACYAVVESMAKIVATGGKSDDIRLTFQEYFESLGEDPKRWGKPFSALLGAYLAQMKTGAASIGGKDSMSGTFNDLDVPPTLVSFAVSPAKASNVISPEFKQAGSTIILLNTKYDDNDLPDFDNLKANFTLLEKLIESKNVISAATVGVGGIAAVISKMSFGNGIGAKIEHDDLFNPSYGSFVLEVQNFDENTFKGYNYKVLGKTTGDKDIIANGTTVKFDKALKAWFKPLETVYPTRYYASFEDKNIEIPYFNVSVKKTNAHGIASPRVVIPVFPGNNCEYDTMRAFEKAGAIVDTHIICNLKKEWLEESIEKMVTLINNSQIIMIPGGFSAGDEPEGSGKFIAAFFRNPRVKDAVMNLLKNRDGLMLGICNGFQALIKLGLVPYGEIRDMDENSPTLTFNTIGRHISCLTDTKIISNKSPWLWNTKPGDVFKTALSHGEGRFIAKPEVIESLIHNNQIATQYTSPEGKPSYDMRHNPNGSIYAVEGITSPDGRVFGKMGHSERIGKNVYKNVPGPKDQKIFLSGVEYFK